jgi:phosphoribosyl-ATP pyrophosphohydrolase/phosphoribosyl-AMP cyclohydrolase
MSELKNNSKKDSDANSQKDDILFLSYLQDFIDKRKKEMPEGSYTTSLFKKGTRTIAQKVGEEAVETIIGAMADDDENFIYESGDLLYHLIVLLSHKGYRIEDVVRELKKRHS